MTRTIKMDRSGRVVIPLVIREKYGLADGAYRLEISESVDGIVLRPQVEEIPADRDESGWVVFGSETEEPVDPVEAVERERERRHREIEGGGDSGNDR